MDGSGEPLLCEYGFSHIRKANFSEDEVHEGNYSPIAPELRTDSETAINENSDTFAMASTFYEYATLRSIAPPNDDERVHPVRPESFHGVTGSEADDLWTLMEIMWSLNPATRPSAHLVAEMIWHFEERLKEVTWSGWSLFRLWDWLLSFQASRLSLPMADVAHDISSAALDEPGYVSIFQQYSRLATGEFL